MSGWELRRLPEAGKTLPRALATHLNHSHQARSAPVGACSSGILCLRVTGALAVCHLPFCHAHACPHDSPHACLLPCVCLGITVLCLLPAAAVDVSIHRGDFRGDYAFMIMENAEHAAAAIEHLQGVELGVGFADSPWPALGLGCLCGRLAHCRSVAGLALLLASQPGWGARGSSVLKAACG